MQDQILRQEAFRKSLEKFLDYVLLDWSGCTHVNQNQKLNTCTFDFLLNR